MLEIGNILNINLGKYNSKYCVVRINHFSKTCVLRIVSLPKTKIGSIRTPEYIEISFFAAFAN